MFIATGLFSGADLLPLGVASFGYLGGVHLQNNADIAAYCDAIESGRHAIFRAYVTGPEERLIREFILQLKLGSVRPSHYRQKFGVEVTEKFRPAACLAGRGRVCRRSGTMRSS